MRKQTKPKACKSCGNPLSGKETICPMCGTENKISKPIYKKWWFIVLVAIVVISVAGMIGGGRKGEKIEWSNMKLSELLPEPASDVGDVLANDEDFLSVTFYKISESQYDDYVAECQSAGFNVESSELGSGYDAYNNDGFLLSLWYDDNDEALHISLNAPMDMGTLQWPTSEIANVVPVPQSTIGTISRESSDGFYVYVGDTSKDAYTAYVDECVAKGFTVDYEKGDTYYRANNETGYHLSLSYQGNNVMTIEIKKVENTEKADTPIGGTETTTDGMRPEFKEAMDTYEAFFDEYIAFMKKYAESDGTDLELLSDYADYMSKYAETMEAFEEWENKDLNTAETAYYIEVQTRISQKLLQVAQQVPQ